MAMSAEAPGTRHLEEVAVRGSQAVAALRDASGWIDRKLRYDGQELLDLDTTPPGVKQRILDDVERLSRLLLLYPFWRREIGRMIVEARRTRRGKPVRVLDVGAGHGGLLAEIGDWARRRRIPVELHGLDVAPGSIEAARRLAYEEGRRIELRVGDARNLAYETDSMDVVVTTFVLHHLPPGDVARVLAEVDRVAAVNFFVFDLRRSLGILPIAWALLKVGAFEAPTRHDTVASIRRGYTPKELDALMRAAAVANYRVKTIPPAFLVASRA